jgi:hypothetical protein
VALALSVDEVVVGEGIFFIDDLFLGNNTFPVTAKVDTANVEGNITTILETEIPYLQQNLIGPDATGIMMEYDGHHLLGAGSSRDYGERNKANQTSSARPYR